MRGVGLGMTGWLRRLLYVAGQVHDYLVAGEHHTAVLLLQHVELQRPLGRVLEAGHVVAVVGIGGAGIPIRDLVGRCKIHEIAVAVVGHQI